MRRRFWMKRKSGVLPLVLIGLFLAGLAASLTLPRWSGTSFRAVASNRYRSAAYGVVGDAYTELGRYEEAVAAFQRMVDTRPDQTSFARVSYARELHGDLPGAIEAMQSAVDTAPPGTEASEWTR